jgi:hypothetical protein
MKLDLLTNATVVDAAIKFVEYQSKEKLTMSNEESKELDYNADKQERETGKKERKKAEISYTTTQIKSFN